jgi:calcium-dependent protein kinase
MYSSRLILANMSLAYFRFKMALKNSNYSDAELGEIFLSIDVNENGHIMYTGKLELQLILSCSWYVANNREIEFLAATLEVKGCIEEERIAEAFDRLDSDDSGFISPVSKTPPTLCISTSMDFGH